MRDRGMIFTLGTILVGFVLLGFSADYDMISKQSTLPRTRMGLEKASSQCANVAFNVQRIFKESSGMTVEQSEDTLYLNQTLPVNLSEYRARLKWLANLSRENLQNVSVSVPSSPTVRSGLGFNVTQVSDRKVLVGLPAETESISLSAYAAFNVSNCTFVTPTPGGVQFSAEVDGNPGSCHRSRLINVSDDNLYDVSTGAVTVRVQAGQLTVESNLNGPFTFGLILERNGSVYVLPLVLDARVESHTPYGSKVSGVQLL